jgi:3-hydroxyisobutyrate dehydrogenase
MRIGVAGYGKMGAAMAARLLDRGCDVIVWNRNLDVVRDAGLTFANNPRALAAACQVVISSLFDADAVRAVYEGHDGLIADEVDTLFIEMSTVGPASQRTLSAKVVARGGSFIECPVSGTTAPARAGQLLGLAGGDCADIDRARPVLQHLCRRIVHMGEVGAGARTKLAINLPLIAFWQSFGEAMALMRSLDMEPDSLVELFGDTAGAPAVLKLKSESVASALHGRDSVTPTFDIDSMRKDLQLTLAEASNEAYSLPVANAVLQAMNEASSAGWGKRDCAWMPAYWAAKGESAH